jgi:hypothetical protein
MQIMDWAWSLSDWIILLTGLLVAIYLCGTWNHNHFKNRNVPYIRPVPFFGNKRPAIRSKNKEHFPDYILRTYTELQDHTYGGTFNFMQPVIILRDPELIKTITVKGSEHFTNLPSFLNAANDPLWSRSLFSLSGKHQALKCSGTLDITVTLVGMKSSPLFCNICSMLTPPPPPT